MYKLIYNDRNTVGSIQKGNMSIPICEDNTDYQEFIEWNKEQEVPLDLNSVYTPTEAEVKAKTNAEAIAKLELIDKQSIRGMREWIAKQPDAPQFTLALEAEAVVERDKLTEAA